MNEWKEPAFAKAFPEGALRVAEANQVGNYDGSGQAIALFNGRFYVAEYGHCSCIGPEESMGMINEYDTLIDALRGISSHYRDDVFAMLKAEVG